MKPISNHKPQVEPRKNNEISGLLHEIKSLEDRVNKLNIMYNDLRKITEDLKKKLLSNYQQITRIKRANRNAN
jgi:predicted  nucleic acid-binding Zn-ribbon protein